MEEKENLQPEVPAPVLPIGEERVDWKRPRGEWWTRLAVLALLLALFLPNVGAFGLWDPWETHYGEVTRNMVESYDWISPWWGYRGKIGPHSRQGNYFYSKPILIFWMEASAVRLIGFSDWAIRLPMALFAVLSCFFAYYVCSKLWGRAVGVVCALVMATSPQFFFLARQAQTDMMFGAPMTVGLLFFCLALFGPWEGKASRAGFAAKFLFPLGVLLISTVPQYVVIGTDLVATRAFDQLPFLERVFATVKANGAYHALVYGLMTLALLIWYCFPLVKRLVKREVLDEAFRDKWIRKGYMMVFVVMCGLATMGKGLLGFCLPGAVLLAYIVLTRRWVLLKVVDIPRAILVFVLVSFPWYVAMFVKHGNSFYARFFVHDHFNRLGTGVHQIDSGTFEHFLKWLGVGMYPWVAFVPFVLILLSRLRLSLRTRENQYDLYVFVWFFISYLVFTLAKTKFHHYIFPALPPMALLIGKSLVRYVRRPGMVVRVGALLALGLFVGLTYNLSRDQQLFRNLFTYKYDRRLPEHLPVDAAAHTTEQQGARCSEDPDCGPHESCLDDGTCSRDWSSSQFYAHTTDSVRWLLNQTPLLYDTFVIIIGVAGALGLMLFFFRRTRWLGVGGLLLLGMVQTGWGLSHYLPSLSPHWSQKYVFEDYYDLCGERLEEVEEEAYRPLIKTMGLDSLYDYFGSTSKRVCPYNITSWLIVWRGETYHSYNELMPLEKKNIQLRPYLETVNPVMMTLPRECPIRRLLCPRRFYVFMENRKSNTVSSVATSVNGEIRKIAKDPSSAVGTAFRDVDKFRASRVSNENDFFTLFEVEPGYKKSASDCSCATARIP